MKGHFIISSWCSFFNIKYFLRHANLTVKLCLKMPRVSSKSSANYCHNRVICAMFSEQKRATCKSCKKLEGLSFECVFRTHVGEDFSQAPTRKRKGFFVVISKRALFAASTCTPRERGRSLARRKTYDRKRCYVLNCPVYLEAFAGTRDDNKKRRVREMTHKEQRVTFETAARQ